MVKYDGSELTKNIDYNLPRPNAQTRKQPQNEQTRLHGESIIKRSFHNIELLISKNQGLMKI